MPEVKIIKITGINFAKSTTDPECQKANFEPIVSKMKQNFGRWKGRQLSLLGRVLIAKSHGISQLQYTASCIETPAKYLKEAQAAINRFVWGGNNKAGAAYTALEMKEGGLTSPCWKM